MIEAFDDVSDPTTKELDASIIKDVQSASGELVTAWFAVSPGRSS